MSTPGQILMTFITLMCLWGATGLGAESESEPVKVAVLGEGQTQSLADLLMVELGRNEACQLVERGELRRLADEASVQKLSGVSRPVALARLAGADALVFLELKETEPKKSAVAVTLVGTRDGRIRRIVWVPVEGEASTSARLAAARLLPMLPSLQRGAADKGAGESVSLLGLRAQVPDATLVELETNLNALLAHRLSAYPGLVVLERWRMDDLVFENNLAKAAAEDFATGGRLASGSLKQVGDVIDVRLVVKRAESGPGVVTDLEGAVSQLPELVERLAGKIAGVPVNGVVPWKPQEEARTFGELGEWLMKHGLWRQSAQAFESAVALGDRRLPTLIARAHAYSLCAYPDDLRSGYSTDGGYRQGLLTPESMGYRLESATKAVHAAADIAHREMDATEPKRPGMETPPLLGRQILRAALCTLRGAHELNVHIKYMSQVTALRAAMQRLVAVLDAGPMRQDLFYQLNKAAYAAYWCATPADTLAYYRTVLAPGYGRDIRDLLKAGWDKSLRRGFCNDSQRHGPMLDFPLENSTVVDRMQRGAERLIDWQAPDQNSVLPLWRSFLDSLQASSSPRDQADGLGFQMKSHRLPASRIRDLELAAALFTRHRAMLTSADGEVMLAAMKPDFLSIGAPPQKLAPALKSMSVFLRELFDQASWIPRDWMIGVDWMTSGIAKAALKADEVAPLLKAMNGYRERTRADARWEEFDPIMRQPMSAIFEAARKKLEEAWPAEQKAIPTPATGVPPYIVTRFWNPARHASNAGYRGAIEGTSVLLTGGQMWIMYLGGGVISVDERTFETTVWEAPSRTSLLRGLLESVVVQPQHIYVATQEGVWRCNRDAKDWSKLELPKTVYRLQHLAKGVGITYGNDPSISRGVGQGAGVGMLDQDQVRWIASTRRRPAEHPFDEAPVRQLLGIFPGTRGEPWLAWNQDIRKVAVHPLNAKLDEGLKFTNWLQVVSCGDRTLLFEIFRPPGEYLKVSQVWALRPDRDQPELLMHHPAALTLPAGTTPVWKFPDSLPQGSRGSLTYCAVLRGESLWVLSIEKENFQDVKATYTLWGFLRGRPDPVKVPLQFELQPEDLAVMSKDPLSDPYGKTLNPECTQRNFIAGEHGLVVTGWRCKGVWMLPWEELDKWIRDHAAMGSVR
ncbi:hypothetical protein [Verrucomicrobium sp. BvORR034]|uniref:hypothetical protein n=1 Tax=Verrucomicrobium sp. BvORR034 TaxID=1396418 RepID=UPI000678C066|nr:hypothetical protein [Verrucomicrobium sp. BvORR034]